MDWFRLVLLATFFAILPAIYLKPQSQPHITNPDIINLSAESCGNPCVIHRSNGGFVSNFIQEGLRILEEDRLLIINGRCASACTILADMLRPNNVCVTENARLEFHNGYVSQNGRFLYRVELYHHYNKDMIKWAISKGGFPGFTEHDHSTLSMSQSDMAKFFRTCSNQ